MPAFKPDKLKVNLRLSISRLRLLEKKKTEQAMKARKEIADYLKQKKYDRAKIRVEHIIREDYMVEALEILELYCDMLLARFGLIETMGYCEEGLQEAVSTLIWAAPRLQADIQELATVSHQLCAKYGVEFGQQARCNKMCMVSDKVITKLGVEPPSSQMVESYMTIIAENYHIPYAGDPSAALEDDEEIGTEPFMPPAMEKSGPPSGGGYYPGAPQGGNQYQGGPPGGNPQYPGPPGGNPQYPGPPGGNPQYPGPPGGNPQYQGPPGGNPQYQGPPGGNPQNPGPPGGYSAPGSQKWTQPPTNPPGMGGAAKPPPHSTGVQLPYPTGNQPHKMPTGPVDDSLDLPPVPTNRIHGNDPVGGDTGDVDFDDLTRRFEQLKKKK